jgi:predicted nuclease of predicted toxin-antitoxin system
MLGADVAEALREVGCDVVRVSEIGMERADDSSILAEAVRHSRVLVTLDGHFGDWAVLPLSTHPGVVRVKADPATSDAVISLLEEFVRAHAQRDLADTLVIAARRSLRWVLTGRGL